MRRDVLNRIVVTAAATIVLGLAGPASAGKNGGGTGGATTAHDPIVFVHGYSGWGGNFGTMVNRFKADGWTANESWTINYDSCNAISTAASELNKFINDVLRQTGATKVEIIAHSYGGLVARAADQRKIHQFAALGSPFKGTDAAYLCGCPSCFARERGAAGDGVWTRCRSGATGFGHRAHPDPHAAAFGSGCSNEDPPRGIAARDCDGRRPR